MGEHRVLRAFEDGEQVVPDRSPAVLGNQYPTTSTGTPLGMYEAAVAMSPDQEWWIQIWPAGTSV